MDLDRAQEITGAICDGILVKECLSKEVPRWLAEVTLSEMLDARRIVKRQNESQQPDEHGWRTFHLVPEESLIAAVYTLLHYDPEDRAIVADGRGRVLAIVAQRSDEDADEPECVLA